MSSNSYYMLVSSLPALPPRLDAGKLPIELERLQTRLRMLEPKDAGTVNRMLDVLAWNRQVVEATDAAVARRYSELMKEIDNRLVREVLDVGIDVRMIVAALRRRRAGLGAPSIGMGRYIGQIRRNFSQPDFGLGHIFAWLVAFERMLEQEDVLNLYRMVLEEIWKYVRSRMQDYDPFSFEAVVLYLAGWDALSQWQQLEAERGRVVFEASVTEAMGEYAELFS